MNLVLKFLKYFTGQDKMFRPKQLLHIYLLYVEITYETSLTSQLYFLDIDDSKKNVCRIFLRR